MGSSSGRRAASLTLGVARVLTPKTKLAAKMLNADSIKRAVINATPPIGDRVPLCNQQVEKEKTTFALRRNLILQERPAKGAVSAKLCSLQAQRFSVEKQFAHRAKHGGLGDTTHTMHSRSAIQFHNRTNRPGGRLMD